MMKAYRIEWAANRGTLVDLGYDYNLPRVECLACCLRWKYWGEPSIEYPAFKFDFLNKKEFNFKRVVSVSEFEQIRSRIVHAAGRPVMVVPGLCIGPLSGTTWTRRLDDFIWGRIGVPQISKRARDLIASEGINLITAEMNVRCRGRSVDSHLALQVEPVPLLTEENLRHFFIKQCSVCGNFARCAIGDKPPPVGNKPSTLEGLVIQKSAWPSGQHLVQSAEIGRVIASNELIEAVKKHKLSGIVFPECGEYV